MSDVQLWKGAIAPATAVAALSAIVLTVINGKPGLFGSLLASFTVIIFLAFIY